MDWEEIFLFHFTVSLLLQNIESFSLNNFRDICDFFKVLVFIGTNKLDATISQDKSSMVAAVRQVRHVTTLTPLIRIQGFFLAMVINNNIYHIININNIINNVISVYFQT